MSCDSEHDRMPPSVAITDQLGTFVAYLTGNGKYAVTLPDLGYVEFDIDQLQSRGYSTMIPPLINPDRPPPRFV